MFMAETANPCWVLFGVGASTSMSPMAGIKSSAAFMTRCIAVREFYRDALNNLMPKDTGPANFVIALKFFKISCLQWSSTDDHQESIDRAVKSVKGYHASGST
ncbi:hypothetical protein AKJ16_DCAP07679, partial [Drosera capensis]